jgi:hypothetical protein
MRKLYFLIFFISIIFSATAKEWIGLTSATQKAAGIELISSDRQTTVLKATVAGFSRADVNTARGTASAISLDNAFPLLAAGSPAVIKLSASVIIPDMAKMKVEAIASSYTDIPNFELAPSKGTQLRTININDVPYTYSASFSQNTFYPGNLASLQSPYILRDYRGQTVWIYPFQYNPVTKILRVYTEITIKISQESELGENIFIRNRAMTSIDYDFHNIYSNHFLNYNNVRAYNPVAETGSMLIISYASFMATVQPLVDWKIKRGLSVEMVSVTTAGSTASAIKTYITNYYNSHNLKYVLLVGDAAQIPTLTASGGASDPSYGYIVGSDSYPEVFIGRFSGTTTTDIGTQVTRTINYERYPQASAAWYGHAVGIASNLGPGDDNEYDWEHERNIRTKLMAFTYNDIAELYDGTHNVVDATGNPTSTDLISTLNSGVSLLNYTGHGSQTAFVTTGFSTSNMTSLTNTNKLPFVVSVGCVNGDFTTSTCLAESFLRSQNGGQPTGALATFMSSINQYWNEPMRAQDEMTDLLVGTYSTNIKRTLGGISENGCMNMNDVYGSTGYDMTNTWHIFGDPSTPIRTKTPTAITATNVPTVPGGTTDLLVNCNTEGALVSLTMNGQIIGTGIVASGSVDIAFPAVTAPNTIYVTITAFNAIPYEGTVLVEDPTSVNSVSSSWNLFSITPNPAREKVNIFFNLDKTTAALKIFNVVGQEVKSIEGISGNGNYSFDTAELGQGVYFAKLITTSSEATIKFVIE